MTTYSHSRLSTFENCPRQYWYGYISKPDIEQVETVEAFLGIRVHEALEELYRRRMGGQLMSCDEVLAFFNAAWDRLWTDDIRIVKQQFRAEDYHQVGRDSLNAYYARYAPFNQANTLRLEGLVSIDLLNDGKYRLRGVIDRLDQRRDSGYEIHDYKTSQSMPTQVQADEDRQLALYQIAVQQMWNDAADIELIWHYVRFDKELRSRRTLEQIEAVKHQCVSLIDDIEARGREEDRFPPTPSNLCPWCQYRSICPAQRHHFAVENLPPEELSADTGVKLIDLLVELRTKKRDLNEQIYTLDGQMDSVKETLIRFAQQQGITSVCGSSHEASITKQDRVVLPESGTPERAALEEALKELGLYDAVTVINWQRLNSLWQSNQLEETAKRCIEQHIAVSDEKRVGLRRIRE